MFITLNYPTTAAQASLYCSDQEIFNYGFRTGHKSNDWSIDLLEVGKLFRKSEKVFKNKFRPKIH